MHKWEESIKVGLTLKWSQKWYSDEFGTVALFPGSNPRCWWSTHCHRILIVSWCFFPSHSSTAQFFPFLKKILAGRMFKICITITNNKEITAMIFCYFFFFCFLIHKILKDGPEGKSHHPFKCEYLWIFGRNLFKSRLCAWLPFTTGKCLQRYVDNIHILHNCELDQQCPWAGIVKRTNPASFFLRICLWF